MVCSNTFFLSSFLLPCVRLVNSTHIDPQWVLLGNSESFFCLYACLQKCDAVTLYWSEWKKYARYRLCLNTFIRYIRNQLIKNNNVNGQISNCYLYLYDVLQSDTLRTKLQMRQIQYGT